MSEEVLDVLFCSPSGEYPQKMVVRQCAACGRRRAYVWYRYVPARGQCPCSHKRMTPAKKAMEFIDQLEPLLGIVPLDDPVLYHERTGDGACFAIGFSGKENRYLYYNFGSLPLGDNSPTWVYLVEFPDWHGERFIKVGIGLDARIRDHELQGARVLQKVELPRWHALTVERAVLRSYPRFRPLVPLPQNGDTECLNWRAASEINLRTISRAAPTQAPS